jgi:PAS domain S-box-containing protein
MPRSARSSEIATDLIDAAPDAMLVVDAKGCIVLANRQVEALFGYQRHELIGQLVEMLVPEPLRAAHVARRTAYVQAPAVRAMGQGDLLYGRRRDGTQFAAEVSLSPVRRGEQRLYVAAIRDVTAHQYAFAEQTRLLRQAEAAEGRFRSLLESAPDAMVIAGLDGRIILVNGQLELLFGYGRDDLIGHPVEVLMPERFRRQHVGHRAEYQAAPRVRAMGEGYELFGRRKDGSEFPVEISLSPVQWDGIDFVSAAIRDISHRQEVELAVRRQAALLDLAPVAVLVRDQWSAIQYWNPAAARLYGWTQAEAHGQVTHTLLRTRFPESLAAVTHALETTGFWEGELRHTRKDGTELIVMSRHALERNQAGEPVAILEINQDVTAARRADQALRDSEERFRLLVDGARDYAQFLLTPDGLVSTWNAGAERLKGYPSSEIIGKHFSRFYTPEDVRAGVPDQLLRAASAEGRVHAEGWRVRRDGSRFWAEVMLTALRNDATGELRGFAKLTRDITERRANEEHLQQIAAELARSNAELEQFAYIASHDLQEPLRMVASYTQLLRRRYTGKLDADADEFIGYAVDGALRMQALINGLLTYARVGTRLLELESVDANQIVDAVVADLAAAIADSNATIIRDPLPTVLADATQLHQLFLNLISNAIKFRVAAPPVVRINAQPLADEWVISVRDQGIGIPADSLERIFMIFQRLHTHQEYPGNGIGLAVCKRVVERMGGRIWVDSQPGDGTTFFFSLKRPSTAGSSFA